MAHFIDRRLNSKGKSTLNRQRFLKRYKQQIKRAVADAVGQRSVTDVNSGEQVSIPTRDISEPLFRTDKGGKRTQVHPGNDQFSEGDRVERPPAQDGQGTGQGDAGNEGEGKDDFTFSISKDEYLDLLFEDLALPNLKKSQYDQIVQYESYRAGFQTDGVPTNLDVIRSLKGSMARKIALTATDKRKLKACEEELDSIENLTPPDVHAIATLKDTIARLKAKIANTPFIDTFDLRFRNYAKKPVPTSKAVMFCIMDVSGSMDQATKNMAKRFYVLLYLFLTRTYKNVEVVYIRHHTKAKEVNEHDFFYSQETGGTIVSSALALMDQIVQERYRESDWNIYAAQASDGDNWADDSPQCKALLTQKILPTTRYFAYIEITERQHQSLWREYKSVEEQSSNFVCQHITHASDIYPVFRKIFKQTTDSEKSRSA